MHWILLLAFFMFAGCDNEKSTGPATVLPESGTTLYFAECDPSGDTGLGGLSADGANVCNSDIVLNGNEVVWRSNLFYGISGALSEGYRLVLERDVFDASDTTFVYVNYTGIANSFSRTLVLPPGETSSVREASETADVVVPSDSGASVSIGISGFNVRISTELGGGSHVVVGSDRTSLCEFEIYQGQTGGEGQPNHSVTLAYLNARSPVTPSLYLDYTGGASFTDQLFTFGPRYGVAYLTATSGACRDTALFYAPPPAQGFQVDTLQWFPFVLTDGQNLWQYEYEFGTDSENVCQRLRVFFPGGLVMIDRTFASCTDFVDITYDQRGHLIWIIQRSASLADTAWGYAPATGVLDTTIVSQTIPTGDLVDGHWVNSVVDRYVRHLYSTPFTGGTATLVTDVPAALTTSSVGFVGIAPAFVTSYDEWTINVFDSLGNWITRYPILARDGSSAFYANLLSADSVIVYEAVLTTGNEIRTLKP